MNIILHDIKLLAGNTFWKMLDDNYRGFSDITESFFAPDEFDAEEQRHLVKLLRMIDKQGYLRVFSSLSRSDAGQRLVDTAAGYGEFACSGDCRSYLGIFMAAEAVQYPFAIDSYAIPMVRSSCFRSMNDDGRSDALELMHLARFVRELDIKEELGLDMYGLCGSNECAG